MTIIEITVGAATSFNHPYESYANYKPSVTIKATLESFEDGASVTRELQRRADRIISEEKQRILHNLKIENLEGALKNSVESLAEEEAQLKDKEAKVAAGDLNESYLEYPRQRVASLKQQIEQQKKALLEA